MDFQFFNFSSLEEKIFKGDGLVTSAILQANLVFLSIKLIILLYFRLLDHAALE